MLTRTSHVAALLLFGAAVPAQEPKPPAAAAKPPAAAAQNPAPADAKPQEPAKTPPKEGAQDAAKAAPIPKEKLEQLVAPIALYDDGLLAQVLMASTYPLEIVEAARWQQKNPSLQGEALEKALKDKDWDPSVKSICGLQSVLKRMNDNLEWTQDLGDAFLADQSALMDAVQVMRRKAYESGNLKTSKEQKVEQREDKVIVIESTSPEVVYVPTYYPTAVYPGWGYPSYYYPAMYPAYPPGYAAFSFAVGVAWGAAIWGGCHWGHGGNNNVNIDIDRQNNFGGRTDNNFGGNRPSNRPSGGGGNNKWQHDPSHRKGVGYRDNATAKQFGGAGTSNRVSRDQARGYGPSAGTQPANRGGAGNAARPSAGTTPRTTPSTRPSTGTAGSTSRTNKSTGQRSGSFSGSKSASTARASSSRGASSRGTRSSGSRSGGSRGGGGRGGGRGR
ncbi:MAG TPA: DUF3300 domain-containing protein [Planctomycetota bacterium]|nr:DUF3300 domain-containing protein [Planctomycetota bacterium]